MIASYLPTIKRYQMSAAAFAMIGLKGLGGLRPRRRWSAFGTTCQ
jgi:hypothetical protein